MVSARSISSGSAECSRSSFPFYCVQNVRIVFFMCRICRDSPFYVPLKTLKIIPAAFCPVSVYSLHLPIYRALPCKIPVFVPFVPLPSGLGILLRRIEFSFLPCFRPFSYSFIFTRFWLNIGFYELFHKFHSGRKGRKGRKGFSITPCFTWL